MASKVTRIYTGLAGLPVCTEPHRELIKYYGKILRALVKLPESSQYRIATEKIVTERKKIVETTPDPSEIERKIGNGLCEELIEQAKAELKLVSTMEKYKPWESLEEKPNANQWKWPL